MVIMELKRKVVLLGDSGVGKTSLVRRFVYEQFSDDYIQTIGTKVNKKEIMLHYDGEAHKISLVIWDVLGQQGYSRVKSAAFRGADGAIFVCDLTRKNTLHSILHYWIPMLETVAGVPGMLLANKSDLDNIDITKEELDEFSKITGLPYLITSAKTGENVEYAFYQLSRLMLIFKPIRSSENIDKKLGTLKDALDYIMTDFSRNYGNWNEGMAVIETNIRAIGMDISTPTVEQLHLLIDKLYHIELYRIGEERAKTSRVRRLGIVEQVLS